MEKKAKLKYFYWIAKRHFCRYQSQCNSSKKNVRETLLRIFFLQNIIPRTNPLWENTLPLLLEFLKYPVLPELSRQKSPILVQFIAKLARFLAQIRGKFASFYPFFWKYLPLTPEISSFIAILCINIFQFSPKSLSIFLLWKNI